MDWFSWLARTRLEPSLIYEYGLAFARNELQKEDLAYFNHEFLQSMGISVAEHRLEILKLARKEAGVGTISLSKLKNAINNTRKSIGKCIAKLVFHDQESVFKAWPEPVRYKEHWRGGLTRNYKSEKEIVHVEKLQTPVTKTRRQAKSGPLDGRLMPENMSQKPRILKLSGPLDGRLPKQLIPRNNLKLSGSLEGKVQEKLEFASRSPVLYGSSVGKVQQKFTVGGGKSPKVPRPLEGKKDRMTRHDLDDKSLWSALFQDMKPT